MSDTLSLRTRIEYLIAHTEALHTAMPEPHGRLTEGYGMAIRDVKAILAAYPADTETEKVKGDSPLGRIRRLIKQLDHWESEGHSTAGIGYLRRHFAGTK